MDNELVISGIGVSEEVTTTIVRMAAEKVAGVASVGERDLLEEIRSGLVSLFTQQPAVVAHPVTCTKTEDGLVIDVHVTVFLAIASPSSPKTCAVPSPRPSRPRSACR